jgi:hypothetical protein
MKKTIHKGPLKDSPEQVTPVEALARMKSFVVERKEKFVAAIKKSKARDLPASEK